MNAITEIFAVLAGVLHIGIFAMESLLFTRPFVQRSFLGDQPMTPAVKLFAFNQGFYNLFLALGLFAGLALKKDAYVIFPCACMVGAGLVLIATDRRMLRPGAMQLVPPAIALASLAV